MPLSLAEDHIKSNEMMLFDYNRSLEETFSPVNLNEKFLEQKIFELEEISQVRDCLYWLTLARLNELVLFCAGNYADNFEFTHAGDLLVNPRCILVHIKNRNRPVIKKRHSRITDQFKNFGSTKGEVIQWLKNETLLEIKEEPLLPYLFKSLKNSGYMSREYLISIDMRMKKIADVMVFLCSLHFTDSQDPYQCLQYMTQSERRFIKSSLCQFDTRSYYDLGYDIHKMIQHEGYISKFLC
ncbi:MAG TPA: hypothetical protein PK874_04925 [Desulfobacteraceae bacterium]|nr:hypothetical protein [Desulfobacteraceae bacterium]HPQ29726.1 hypothetical protein [Desulfobacteraceae bacterium]